MSANKKTAVKNAVNQLEEINRELDRRFNEQQDNCTKMLEQIKNSHNGKSSK